MPRPYTIPVWKNAPFIRLLIPLIAGILMQWYFTVSLPVIQASVVSFAVAFLLFYLLPESVKFRLRGLHGVIINLLFVSAGLWLSWQKDIRHDVAWYGNYYSDGSYLVIRIDEPLTEKAKSFKADGYVESIVTGNEKIYCKGKLLLYFSKDSSTPDLKYGDKIIIHKDLQRIKNSGNPGGFNYERYAVFQGIFHNVFLKSKDWSKVEGKDGVAKNWFKEFVFDARAYVLGELRKVVTAGKDELGIAQALLIGYTNDLDKDLVQAFSNTGVVHIIAISGMHLGLIYILLLWLFTKIPVVNNSKLLQVILMLACLWLFAILTGASPSVLRAAVMFSFIMAGRNLKKRVSIYSSLAASAFVLLCYNPFYLWAVGFQLSYLAVIGIVIFQRPVYNLLYIKNKLIDRVWMLVSVSAAAQILTFPACIYYFHQFPNLFLVSNIIAVPLAMLILYSAIALISFSWIPFLGVWLGKLVGGLTWVLNKTILWINSLSFSVWDQLPANILSTWLLYLIVTGFGFWMILKNKKYFWLAMFSLTGFVVHYSINKWEVANQQKIIVYNVPQHRAIDLISGSKYQFVGDSVLLDDGMLQNFHLKPARIFFQLTKRIDTFAVVFNEDLCYQFKGKKILNIQRPFNADTALLKPTIDLVIISKNPGITIAMLAAIFNCKQIVFDASNPVWKIKKWQEECDQLKIKNHSVPHSGAFVINLGT